MILPAYVLQTLNALKNAGYPAFAVGGCVRDDRLGRQPHDYDLCTAAPPEETQRIFSGFPLFLAGLKHGTVSVVTDGQVLEITTFRKEGGYQDNRRPGWVEFVSDIETDLARRDFTINAMAYAPDTGLVDPFGGEEDLRRGILRCVGDAAQRFEEDALRILRGLRFAARFHLVIEDATRQAMLDKRHLMAHLARERVFEEVTKLLLCVEAADLISYSPILSAAIPELAPMVGFDQKSPHHAYDVFTHTAQVVQGVPAEPALRWAALLHDAGKPRCFTVDESGRGHFLGHAQAGAEIADSVLRTLKAPTALREKAVFLIAHHMTPLLPDKKLLRRYASRWGTENVQALLSLQKADFGAKGVISSTSPDFDEIGKILQEILTENSCLTVKDLALNGHDLMALGLSGREIGLYLNQLLAQVLEETVPNTPEALTDLVRRWQETH